MAVNLDLDIVRDYIEDDLNDNGYADKITFEYEQDEKSVKVTANVSTSLYDDIFISLGGNEGGGVSLRAVFDKINKNSTTLELVNSFNANNFYLKAFIRDDGYFEIAHETVTYEESYYKDCSSEFLSRLPDLSDVAEVKRLVSMLYSK